MGDSTLKEKFWIRPYFRKSKSFKTKLYSPCANVDASSLAKGFRSAAQNILHKIIENIHHKILKIHHKELKLHNKILNIRLKILHTQVCLWVIVPLENFSLIWRRHHYRWNCCKFWPILSTYGHWAVRVLNVLWHRTSVYNGHLRRPVTHIVLTT